MQNCPLGWISVCTVPWDELVSSRVYFWERFHHDFCGRGFNLLKNSLWLCIFSELHCRSKNEHFIWWQCFWMHSYEQRLIKTLKILRQWCCIQFYSVPLIQDTHHLVHESSRGRQRLSSCFFCWSLPNYTFHTFLSFSSSLHHPVMSCSREIFKLLSAIILLKGFPCFLISWM